MSFEDAYIVLLIIGLLWAVSGMVEPLMIWMGLKPRPVPPKSWEQMSEWEKKMKAEDIWQSRSGGSGIYEY